MKSMENKLTPIPFSKKAGDILWAKGAVANTFGVIKTGMLAARMENDPQNKDGKIVFKFVPGMVLGESSILGMIRKKEEYRNACIFVPDNCEQVTGFEYHPEFLKYEIENGRNDLAYSLITNLWAHTIVNYHRLQYGNERDETIIDDINTGVGLTVKSMRRMRHDIGNFQQFSKEFRHLFCYRDSSRNLYTEFTNYDDEAGLDESYKAFLDIFDSEKVNTPIKFKKLLLKMLDFIKNHKMQSDFSGLDDLATQYEN